MWRRRCVARETVSENVADTNVLISGIVFSDKPFVLVDAGFVVLAYAAIEVRRARGLWGGAGR
jgi:hypothetical protein